MVRRKNSGAVLFETILTVGLLVCLAAMGHLKLMKRWGDKFDLLQKERLPYDGVKSWMP